MLCHPMVRYAMLCYAMLCYAMLCYAMLCYAMLCYAMLCYAVVCYAMLCYAVVCYAMLCYAAVCYAMLCYAMLCYAMLCYAMLCYAMLCYAMQCYADLCYATLGYAILAGLCHPKAMLCYPCNAMLSVLCCARPGCAVLAYNHCIAISNLLCMQYASVHACSHGADCPKHHGNDVGQGGLCKSSYRCVSVCQPRRGRDANTARQSQQCWISPRLAPRQGTNFDSHARTYDSSLQHSFAQDLSYQSLCSSCHTS